MNQDETEKIGSFPEDEAPQLRPCLMILSGLSTGQSYRLSSPEVLVGRADDANIILTDRGISRHHAKFLVAQDGSVELQDLKSTNGTFVGAERIDSFILKGGERIRFGGAVKMRFDFRDPMEESLLERATRDPLTGALNRRYFNQRIKEATARSKRHQTSLCCAFIDADHFKAVNDEHGHAAGDQVLKELVKRALSIKREEDVFARFGGEEFVLLLPATPLEGAVGVLERVRQSIEAEPFKVQSLKGPVELDVTISVGLAQTCGELDGEELLQAADEALLRAKKEGRNRLVIQGA